jgi:hypothetical protein
MENTLQKILVNGQEIDQIFYKGIPVVTFEHIAIVHGVPVRNIHKTFERHKEEFVEHEDYFRLDFAEATQLLLKVEVSPNGLLLFTEGGYLLLVKPMRDKVSWQVQRMMRDAYFREQARQSDSESAIERLADLIGVGYKKLDGRIDSVEQNTRARIDDEQRITHARFQRLETSLGRSRDEQEDLKKTVEAMATVAAGPFPGVMVNSVRGYIRNRLEMLGLDKNKVPKLFLEAFKAFMREHYLCQNQCGGEIYKTDDLREAYETPGFGTEEHRHLAGDERLQAEVRLFLEWCTGHPKKDQKNPQFPRAVKSPRMYEPRDDGV